MQRDEEWYWSLSQHRVVRGGEARDDDVLGPYPTREEAEGALDKVRARNDALAAQEEAELRERLADLPEDEREEKLAELRDRQRYGS